MLVCSLRSKDNDFADKFLKNHPEYSDRLGEHAKEVIASMVSYLFSARGQDAYNEDNFIDYINSTINSTLGKDDYDLYKATKEGLKEVAEDIGIDVTTEALKYKKGSKEEEFVKSFPQFFEVFKDSQGNYFAVFKDIELDEKIGQTVQEKTVDRLNKLAEKKATVRSSKDENGFIVWDYDGKEIKAKSVSTDVYGTSNMSEKFPVLASEVGTLVDHIVRDFFDPDSELVKLIYSGEEEIDMDALRQLAAERYGGMITAEGLIALTDDLDRVEKLLEEKFGAGYQVVSKEITLFAQKQDGSEEWLTGKPDLLVVDAHGTIHVVDIKTKMYNTSEDYHYNVGRSKAAYSRQISRYIKMLQAQGFKVADSPTILLAESYCDNYTNGENAQEKKYEVTKPHPSESENKTSTIKVEDENGDWITLGEYAEQYPDNDIYQEPRIHFKEEDDRFPVDTLVDIEFERMTSDGLREDLPNFKGVEDENTNDILLEQLGVPLQRQYSSPIVTLSSQDVFSNPELIGSEEIHHVANGIMYLVADYIEKLKSGKLDEILDESLIELTNGVDYKGRTSQEIVNSIGIDNLINLAVEETLDTITTDSIREDFDSEEEYLDAINNDAKTRMAIKMAFLRDHAKQLKEIGYPLLLKLEDCLVLQEATNEDAESAGLDMGDNDALNTLLERLTDGLSDAEAWMLGERNFSPKASLAQELRRIFEGILERDADGNPVDSRYGYRNIKERVDATMAVQSVYDWVSNCETIQEMWQALANHNTPATRWVEDIMNTISADENLLKKFFVFFRKDSTKYSIVRASYDSNGKMVLKTEIINTKSAYQTMLNSVSVSYNNFNVGKLYDKSDNTIDNDTVHKMQKRIKELKETIAEFYKRVNKRDSNYLDIILNKFSNNNIAKQVTEVLNDIGVLVPEEVVNNYIRNNLKGSTTNGAGRLLAKAFAILGKVDSPNYKNIKGANPFAKGASPSVFSEYADLLHMLADAVQEHVEASVYQDGKTYYSYCNPSFLMHQIRNLKNSLNDETKFDNYINREFGMYEGWFKDADGNWLNDWIEKLNDPNNSDMREMLDHKVQLSYIGNQYKELGALGYQLSLLTEYFGSKDDPKGSAWYALPTMSNKPVSEFIRFVRYNSHNDIVSNVLMNTYIQEVNRIVDVLQNWVDDGDKTDQFDITDTNLKKEGKFTKEEIADLKDRAKHGKLTTEDMYRLSKVTSGAKFHFLYYFNNEMRNANSDIASLTVKKINSILANEDFEDAVELTGKLRDFITNKTNELVNEEFQKMVDMGILDTKTIKVGKYETREVCKYWERFGKNMSFDSNREKTNPTSIEDQKTAMEKAIKDFIWNDYAANINIIQITGVDLAYYGNSVNYQKRIAQIHSPGTHLCSEKELYGEDAVDDGYLRSVHISDEFAVSEVTQNAIAALEDYKNKLPKNQQEEFGRMIKIIAAGFEEINVTDGQSFSCPTSNRKKLTLQGDWDETMEEAYNRIREGNFDLNDLGVMWNPLKPFVTAQIPKYSGSSTMTFRKKPMQDKNSEYMLLLAEALSYQSGRASKMTAIYDWMESTHWSEYDFENHRPAKNATYKQNGIDTVHFASVGKVGVTGVIDISEKGNDGKKLSNKEVIDKLNFAVSYNDSRDGNIAYQEAKSEFTEYGAYFDETYDDAYVDTIPVENYIIQQQVPAHLLEHEQLYGSQIRILGVSDITPGTEFSVNGEKMSDSELVNEYKELHATNIREAFNDLMESLGIKNEDSSKALTVQEKNARLEKLEKILQREILKDSKYGYDIKRACTLQVIDENTGEKDFVIPPLDPIQSSRIQMLLNSIIKKSINKQKIKGGPTVQTTVYDNDLHIVFKGKDGKPLSKTRKDFASDEEYKKYVDENQDGIAYFECYMPVPNAKLEKLMTREDGSMMSLEEVKKIMGEESWNAMSQIIGYRIPTEDKYSMIPLKIVGFVPKAAGQVVMMPKEITYLTGSDFDIDKMYLMMKSFNEKMPKLKELVSMLKESLNSSGKNYDDYFDNIDVWNTLERLRDGIPYNSEDPKIKAIADWYKKTAIKLMFKELKDMKSESRKSAREARNNRILDLQWSVLTNKDTASKMMNPGNFNVQKRTGRIIKILKEQAKDESIVNPKTNKPWTFDELKDLFNENGASALDSILENTDLHSVTLPSNKIYFQQQNMQGTQMVGIFANHNVSHAFVSFQKVGIDLGKKSFWFNGVEIGNPNNMIVLDKMQGFDGKLISKTIAEFLAASVDTAKDPTLRDLNVNTFTGTVAMTLARLGFDTESIGLFLAQPIIQRVTDLYFKNSNEGFYLGTTAIKEVWKEFFGNDTVDYKELYRTDYLTSDSITKESLIENIGEKLELDENEAIDSEFQKKVLIMFNQLYAMAKDINELTFCTKFNSVSNSVGPTIAATTEKELRVQRFRDDVMNDNTCFYTPENDSDPYSNAADVIENDPILNAFYSNTIDKGGAANKIMEPYFPHYFPGFRSILDLFSKSYLKNKKVNEKLYNKLINDYMFYLLTYNNESRGIRATLPSGDAEMKYFIKGMVNRFKRIQGKKGRKPNVILDQGIANNCLRIRVKDPFIPMDTLVFNSGQLNSDNQEQIKTAWSDLVTSEDPEIRSFGIDLFYYTLLRNGFGFSPKTLMHLASTIVRQNAQGADVNGKPYSNYIDGIRNLRSVDGFIDSDPIAAQDFLRMFVRNHSNDKSLVPTIQLDDSVEFGTADRGDSAEVRREKERRVSIVADENHKYILDKVMIDKDNACPFISLPIKIGNTTRTVLCELDRDVSPSGITVGYSDGTLKTFVNYKQVNKLGLTNNFLEYNANDPMEESYFDNVRDDIEEEESEEAPESFGVEQETGEESITLLDEDTIESIANKLGNVVKAKGIKQKIGKKDFKDALRAVDSNVDIENIVNSKLKELLDNDALSAAEKEMEDFLNANNICN